MAKPVAVGWLVGAIVVLTSLAVAACLVPLRPCGTCDGLAMALHFRTSPSIPPTPPPRIDCPDCADRGKVSLFRSWRPMVSPETGAIVRGLKDPSGTDNLPALTALLQTEGMSGAPPLAPQNRNLRQMQGRFHRSDGRTFLVLTTYCPAMMVPGTSSAGVFLLDLRGRVLDYVVGTSDNRVADLYSRILEEPGADGRRVVIFPVPAGDARFSFLLHQWQQPARRVVSEGAKSEREGACRIGVWGARLEALAQEEK
jgi:hypothetical protein